MNTVREKFIGGLFVALCMNAVAIAQTATQPSGSGTAGDPYLVASLDNLYWITQNDTAWGASYRQTADIDASSSSGWDSNQGFTPIGNTTTSFTGTYNGGGHTISGLYISRGSSSYVGMFGLCSGATLKRIGLTGEEVSGDTDVGGLVGYCGNVPVTIDSCYTTGLVSGTTSYIGGLVGTLYAGSTVNRSYSTAHVNNGNYTGGLVGYNSSSTIANSYSTGTVSSASGHQVGGLVGVNGSATINKCYSVGSVSGAANVGGLVGAQASGMAIDCVWDTAASGQTSSAGGTGMSTAEMKTLTTFTSLGWDFELETANGTGNYWDMDTTNQVINSGYPFLSWQNGSNISLPVEMTSLAAHATGATVQLTWRTATEVENYGFEVERRQVKGQNENGKGIGTGWGAIGFVGGAGTSSSPHSYAFEDRDVPPGSYAYRIRQIDRDGTSKYSAELEVQAGIAPEAFTLSQNYPNPFNPATTIVFAVPSDGRATLKIYDMSGREIATLVDEELKAGIYQQATFDASLIASGMYFARLQFGTRTLIRKIMLIK